MARMRLNSMGSTIQCLQRLMLAWHVALVNRIPNHPNTSH